MAYFKHILAIYIIIKIYRNPIYIKQLKIFSINYNFFFLHIFWNKMEMTPLG
jgi:hypothetical protein